MAPKARETSPQILCTTRSSFKRVSKSSIPSNSYLESDDSDLENVVKKINSPRVKRRKLDFNSTKVSVRGKGKENIDPNSLLTEENNFDGSETLPSPRVTPTKIKSTTSESFTSAPDRVIANIFCHAHSVLDTSSTLNSNLPLVGRETEGNILINFLSGRFHQLYPDLDLEKPSGDMQSVLYVSGPPGLGKTVLLSSILFDLNSRISNSSSTTSSTPTKKGKGKAKAVEDVRVIMENCSSFGNVGVEVEIWERLAKGLGVWEKKLKGKGRAAFLEGLKNNPNVKCLIVLDEIDHLLSTTPATKSTKIKESLLNQLFDLVKSRGSQLTLIGIANSLDLTLKAFHSSDSNEMGEVEAEGPTLLHFEPYSADQIALIIRQRLAPLLDVTSYPYTVSKIPKLSYSLPIITPELTADEKMSAKRAPIPLLMPIAVEFLAKKISAITGDIRTALALVQHAIAALQVTNKAKGPLEEFTAITAPIIKMDGILKSLKEFNLSAKVVTLESRLGSLAFNARIALVGLLVGLGREGGEIRMNSSFEIYKEILKKEGTLIGLSKEEFRSSCETTLEGNGFISINVKSISGAIGKKMNGSTNPFITLSSAITSIDLAQALRSVPDPNVTEPITGVLEETLRLCNSLLDFELRRIIGEKKMKEGLKGNGEEEPMEGFHGNGLGSGNWIGSKRRAD